MQQHAVAGIQGVIPGCRYHLGPAAQDRYLVQVLAVHGYDLVFTVRARQADDRDVADLRVFPGIEPVEQVARAGSIGSRC